MKKSRWIAAGLSAGLLVTTALSSAATQYVARVLGYHTALGGPLVEGLYQPFGWLTWQMAPWAAGVRSAFLWPNVGAAALLLVVMGGLAARNLQNSARRPKPFPDVHGSAAWATREDIQAMGLLGKTEGIYVGAWEDPKTKAVHYLRDTSGAHIAGIAPTRSGKGLGWVLPNLLSWTDSLLVFDPKGELWQLTAGWRKSIGHNVLCWQPGSPEFSCGFNFLDTIRLNTPYEVADSQNLSTVIVDPDGAGFSNHWDKSAFGFLTGVFLHCLHVAHDSGQTTSIPAVAQLLSSPTIDPVTLYKRMAASKYGAAINAAGVDQLNRDIRESGAVLSTVKTYLSLFLDPIVARNCSYSSFRVSDLMDHRLPTTLYIMTPGLDSLRLRPLIRLFIILMFGDTIGTPMRFDAQQQPVRAHKHRMLLMMEEFPDLRRMKVFEAAMAIMAGAGLTAFLIMQDREQLLAAYGQHQTIMANVHLIAAYAPNEDKTADWLSHALGNQTINLEQYSASGKRGGRLSNLSHSFSAFARPLLTSDEVKRLPGAIKEGTRIIKAGQMLLLATGRRPILGRQMLYMEAGIFLARSLILPPSESDDLEIVRRFMSRENVA